MAISPLMGGGIGAAVGLLKNRLIDQPAYRDQQAIEAMRTSFGPLIGGTGRTLQRPSAFQSALDFGLTGASAANAFGGPQGELVKGAAQQPKRATFGGTVQATSKAQPAKTLPNTGGSMNQTTFKRPSPEVKLGASDFGMFDAVDFMGNLQGLPPVQQQPLQYETPIGVRSTGRATFGRYN